ncbi:MAG: lytic transglycosylase domain-containing protein [Deltaproteobacteria bacterium]|nr:lytic transglycosylase domain-containing protein [Deltaproteobacteria bacterium]MCX7952772.1 lytic transglycosylase domain-containing protein [Deltaproteobacteria bacterium]
MFFLRLILLLFGAGLRLDPLPVPDELVDRVDFWVKVFGEVSRNQRIIHHRLFPQCVFGILDFSAEANILPKQVLTNVIVDAEESYFEKLRNAFKKFLDGKRPETLFETNVFQVTRKCLKPRRSDIVSYTLAENLIRSQSGVAEKTRDAVTRSFRYLWFIENVLKTYGIPDDIKFLPFVESSFNVNAVSKAGAVGMWQFMPATGRVYGLRIDKFVDERRDPFKSTVAAAKYLLDAYQAFGNWPYALISYNHGVEGLRKKLYEFNIGSNLVRLIEDPFKRPLGFASTNFYPSFVAVVRVFKNYRSFFGDIRTDPPLRVEKHNLAKALTVYSLSKATELPVSSIIEYNPHFSAAVRSGKLHIPAHTLVYLPPGHRINYSKVAVIKPKRPQPSPKEKPKQKY